MDTKMTTFYNSTQIIASDFPSKYSEQNSPPQGTLMKG